jgi:hypothetical protein
MYSLIDFALGLLNPFFIETVDITKPKASSPLMEIVETKNEVGETVYLEMPIVKCGQRTPRQPWFTD